MANWGLRIEVWTEVYRLHMSGAMIAGWAAESAFVTDVPAEEGAVRYHLHPLLVVAFLHTLGGNHDHEP